MATVSAPPEQRHLTDLTLEFLAMLELERGLSRNTLEAYRSDLQQYGAFLGRRGTDPLEVRPADLSAFISELATGREGKAPVGAGHPAAQDRLPALVLPPSAARADHRPRPDRRAAAAALAGPAADGSQPRRGQPAAGPADRRIAGRADATARCWRRCTPAACGPRRRPHSSSPTSTSRRASCVPAARAPRSGWCRSAARRSRRSRPT